MSQEAGRLRWAVQVEAWSPGHAEFELLLSLLPEAERCACTRFRQAQDRKRALVSRLLQRAAAAAALGLRHGGALSVQRTRGNKPYVAGAHRPSHAPNWNYSVSHEGDYVILAAEPVCVCGCDVAAPLTVRRAGGAAGKEQPLAEFFRSFEKQLTAAEWASVRAAGEDGASQEAQFRKFWSLKEAFVKATGEGLGFELGNTEFAISGGTAHQTSPAHEGVASLQDQALLCMGQLSLLVPLCPSALLLQPR
ncbi:hypothetical protein CHLNCDRAFT_55270 [Chlorella variabilis]|uniref:holo-[acyl-carrier-protein] synthase n=1 Tax=Chlorella variabilis TaxID=554065 RepID=E1ZSI4_CHLVA|nr:hypothetical protein CHLNCDRAFT_55270 [Chlorella variabilis]EFN51313.1 hypothetical protein CHLNCDRAFT_55270 [Chlorella variabilis]|eukprot:XP_005843415.1 hypothetical protein CHLNCDRAFT_55270 [Chlorella variabilis]